MAPKKARIPKSLKESVWSEYIGLNNGKAMCMCCNKKEITQFSFHCGHVISEANGGELKLENMRPICELCNKSMKTTNLNDFKELINKKENELNNTNESEKKYKHLVDKMFEGQEEQQKKENKYKHLIDKMFEGQK